ncbi:sodium/glutamate symporter [Helicobacter sp. 16-1353]|uniref:sodium/glutamate symporter n=1 Tax=Helicobacter sp. 16-1353 TaxID=2004996 RepID=UPI000DCC0406|nr:sodium/glutamate symporter [Helicobacter sp. 16-1353]RAX55213.1 sodium/glutamate symporter [Helicobacter sp. 16-1353]
MTLNFYATLVCMVLILLIGRFVIKKVGFLYKYSIPEPVVGGILVAILLLILNAGFGIEIKFDNSLKDPLMLAFFTSIGLGADFSSLKKGGKLLVVFLICAAVLLVCQNIIGVLLTQILGTNPLLGLLGGSITLTGGHGTGAAWGAVFLKSPYDFSPAVEVALAAATFGLISGGIIGGPVARYLINKNNLKPNVKEYADYEAKDEDYKDESLLFETPKKEKLITAHTFIVSLALIAIPMLIGTQIAEMLKNSSFTLPTFVWCLFMGVVIRNVIQGLKLYKVFDREVQVIGDVSLSLFLAFALMTINLLELVGLAIPILIILMAQVAFMIFFAIFVSFRFTGKNYDAAVLSAGLCGFGLGATSTAMVNIQTITNHYGPSHIAFIIVPLCGAFFIDLINAVVIQGFLLLPFFP